VRFLTPTDNKRLNELIGFLCVVFAILVALALISYSPHDVSLNVSAAPGENGVMTRNWIGPVGAYCADLIFQVFGFAAFLLPVAISVLGWRWFRSRSIDSQTATVVGYVLMLLSLPALLCLWNLPGIRGSVPPGGLLGSVISSELRSGFNMWGANLLVIAILITALFMTTRFSFTGAHEWAANSPLGGVAKFNVLQRAAARWHDWRDARENDRMRRRLQETRTSGRKAVNQATGKQIEISRDERGSKTAVAEEEDDEAKTIRLEDQTDIFGLGKDAKTRAAGKKEKQDDQTESREPHKAPIFVMNDEKASAAKKPAADAKIAKGATNYKLPPVSMMREGERSQKIDEEELKMRARAIEEKFAEFDVQGRVTQINPGPVVTTFEFKPEAGIKYNRIIGLTEDLCLALQAESILIERIPGKSTIGIEVPNVNRQTIALREIVEAPEFFNSPSKLTLAMGRDLHGRIRVADLAAMPHVLIAGSTGTGKSVFINSLMMSILYKASPDDVKMVLVDPKRLELNLYENIPHLIAPVVTDPKVASNVLRNATREMENRLKLLAQKGVRNIEQYNRTFQKKESLSLFETVEES
jgi:DNA segregation ATPase FtsK/SpoIIIE, S-DNA-T family